MGQPRVKWGQAERYFLRHGYAIRSQGGDKVIIAPGDSTNRGRQTVRVGHTSCSRPGCELLKCYLSKFRSIFGVTIEEILGE